MKQEFTSKATSINSKKVPALFTAAAGKIEVFWENAECALKPCTPCIFAWANLPGGNQLSAEFELSDDDFDSTEDCEPSEDADNRAAEFLRAEITKQVKEYGIAPESLDFHF